MLKLYSLFLFLICFLPLESIFGEIKGYKGGTPPKIWILSISIILLSNWLLLALIGSSFFDKIGSKLNRLFYKIPNIFFFLIIISSLIGSQIYVFEHKPLIIDSIVQLFQAQIFSFGQLKAKLPPIHEFFVTQHMLFDDWSENGRCGACRYGWFGQYPPGHSLLLVLGILIKKVWLIPVIISSLSSYFIYRFSKNIFGSEVTKITLLLLAFCPFFIFLGSSYMNHTTTLLLITLSVFNIEIYERTNKRLNFCLFIFFLSLTLLVRPLDAIVIGIVFIPAIFSSFIKDKILIFISALCALPSVFSLLVYNKLTTGEYLLAGYIKLWGAGHNLGFHMSPWGIHHTPLTGLRNELVDLQLLQDYLFEWPIPALLPISVLIFTQKSTHLWFKRLLAITIIFPAFYFFYWHRDSFLGPRFLYSSLIGLVPLSAYAIHSFTTNIFEDKTIHIFKLLKPVKYKHFSTSIFISCLVYSATISIPARFHQYSTGLGSMKIDLVSKAKESGIERGLIFVKSSWGVRIFSRIRGLGISASDSQIAYSHIDHCYLDELVKAKNKEKLEEEISLVKTNIDLDIKPQLKSYKANFDPSLLLDPNRTLTRECTEELKYDLKNNLQDYTNYEPHMRVNSPNLDGDFIVVKDLRELNVNLISLYPNYEPYIFNGESFSKVVQ